MTSLSGDLRKRLEASVRESFSVEQLDRLLTYDLTIDRSEKVIPKDAIQAVFELFNAASREGWLERFLRALRNARPSREKAEFRNLVDEALAQLPVTDLSAFAWHGDVALPPCSTCWWRDAAKIGVRELIGKLKESEREMIRGPGLPKLHAWTLSRLSADPNPELGRQIVACANQFLEDAFCKNVAEKRSRETRSRKMRILDRLDRGDNQANWAAVLAEANAHGVKTLVALFLSIYLADRELLSLADSNLQILYKRRKEGLRDG